MTETFDFHAWTVACRLDDIEIDDVVRFDHDGTTYAVYRTAEGVFASDGLCTHERVHLCDGLVMDGVIECPRHNGRFEIRTGRALGAPVCIDLAVHPARVTGDVVEVLLPLPSAV